MIRAYSVISLSLIHISEPTRLGMISYAVFCLKKKHNFFKTQTHKRNVRPCYKSTRCRKNVTQNYQFGADDGKLIQSGCRRPHSGTLLDIAVWTQKPKRQEVTDDCRVPSMLKQSQSIVECCNDSTRRTTRIDNDQVYQDNSMLENVRLSHPRAVQQRHSF